MKQNTDNELWYAYLRAHLDQRTRNLHYTGTILAIGMFISAAITLQPILMLVGLLSAYGMAWFGHFTIEHNQPAAFKRPVLSFLYNFKMLWLWLNNTVEAEFAAAIKAKADTQLNTEAELMNTNTGI